MKGTIISQKNTHLLYIFNPRTYERYNQPISGTDRLMYALIPVPTKGTIKNIIFRSINKRILIPVPVKGTIQSTEALMSAFTILIPVPVKGTILIKLGFPK